MSDEPRFVFLETKFAYQDKLLAELNEALISQQQQLNAALARIRNLEGQLKSVAAMADPAGDEPPPHY